MVDEVAVFNDVLTVDQIDAIRQGTYLSSGGSGSGSTWQTVEYIYDPSGRRIAKAFDGVVTNKYVYDGDQIIAEYDGNDVLVRKYIQGAEIDEPVAMIDVADSNATYYYHYDALGSVVGLSNASGSTVEVYEYSAFGEIAATGRKPGETRGSTLDT